MAEVPAQKHTKVVYGGHEYRCIINNKNSVTKCWRCRHRKCSHTIATRMVSVVGESSPKLRGYLHTPHICTKGGQTEDVSK